MYGRFINDIFGGFVAIFGGRLFGSDVESGIAPISGGIAPISGGIAPISGGIAPIS